MVGKNLPQAKPNPRRSKRKPATKVLYENNYSPLELHGIVEVVDENVTPFVDQLLWVTYKEDKDTNEYQLQSTTAYLCKNGKALMKNFRERQRQNSKDERSKHHIRLIEAIEKSIVKNRRRLRKINIAHRKNGTEPISQDIQGIDQHESDFDPCELPSDSEDEVEIQAGNSTAQDEPPKIRQPGTLVVKETHSHMHPNAYRTARIITHPPNPNQGRIDSTAAVVADNGIPMESNRMDNEERKQSVQPLIATPALKAIAIGYGSAESNAAVQGSSGLSIQATPSIQIASANSISENPKKLETPPHPMHRNEAGYPNISVNGGADKMSLESGSTTNQFPSVVHPFVPVTSAPNVPGRSNQQRREIGIQTPAVILTLGYLQFLQYLQSNQQQRMPAFCPTTQPNITQSTKDSKQSSGIPTQIPAMKRNTVSYADIAHALEGSLRNQMKPKTAAASVTQPKKVDDVIAKEFASIVQNYLDSVKVTSHASGKGASAVQGGITSKKVPQINSSATVNSVGTLDFQAAQQPSLPVKSAVNIQKPVVKQEPDEITEMMDFTPIPIPVPPHAKQGFYDGPAGSTAGTVVVNPLSKFCQQCRKQQAIQQLQTATFIKCTRPFNLQEELEKEDNRDYKNPKARIKRLKNLQQRKAKRDKKRLVKQAEALAIIRANLVIKSE